MNYVVVFDAAQKLPAWQFPALGLLFLGLAVLLWVVRDSAWIARVWTVAWRVSPQSRKTWMLVFLVFSLAWTVVASLFALIPYFATQRAMRTGALRVVEGPVENFHSMPYAGRDTERFEVAGIRFEYSDFEIQPGFNRSSSHGGPIRAGLRVRIHYLGPPDDAMITKLEIAH